MVLNIFFLGLLVLFFVAAFTIFDRDILSPTVLVSSLFIVCSFLYVFNAQKWNSELSFKTICIVLSGLLVFAVIEYMIKMILQTQCVKGGNLSNGFSAIRVEKWKLVLLVAFSLMTTFFYYQEIQRIYSLLGTQYGTNVMQVFRMASAHSTRLDASQMVNPIVVQCSKVMMVSAYICIYVFINNVMLCKESIKRNIIYILFCAIYIVESLMSGGRVQLIYFLAATIFIMYTLWHQKVGWKKNISYKFIVIGAVCLVVFLLIFYNIRYFVGRSQDTMNLFEYFSLYAGAPICLLNAFVNETWHEPPVYFGEETFVGLQTFFYKIGLVDSYRTIQLEFRYADGVGLGNVYTFFRRPLHDFGWIGMLVITALFALIYCYAYHAKIKRINTQQKWSEIPVLLYAMWFYPLVLFPIDNCIYQVVTVGNVVTTFLLVLMAIFLLHTRIKFFK